MTYRQSLTKQQAVKQINTTELHQLTSRQLIPAYEQKIKQWLACSVAEVPSPQLVMVRVTLCDAVTISKFTAWLVDYYRKKTPRQPFKYLWVKENRDSDAEDYQGTHYHFAVMTSAGLTNMPTAAFAIAQEKGLIASWWCSRDLQGRQWLPFDQQRDLPHQVHYLRTQHGLNEAMQHLAYLAKQETKQIASRQRSIGCSGG